MQYKALPHLTLLTSLLLCAFPASAEILEVKVSNPDGSPVDTLVVFAQPLDFDPPAQVTEKVEIAQQEWAFNPYMTVVQLQDEIAFTNKDDFTHHIYSVSGNNRFSFKLKAKDTHSLQPKLAENKVAQIAMGCNIHDWMSGYILVVDTPYFGKSDDLGVTRLQLEQPGRYQVSLWHPQLEAEDRLLSRVIDVHNDLTFEWSLPTQLEVKLPEVNEEEFDFLEKY